MIQASIINKFGSLDQFTTELRLRLLLRPMSYAADLQALRNREATLNNTLSKKSSSTWRPRQGRWRVWSVALERASQRWLR